MKNCGSTFEYARERDEDIMRAYLEQINSCDVIQLKSIFQKVVNSPSKRFWVSPERAAIVVSRMMRGDLLQQMRPTKREMFNEIYRRVMVLRRQHPNASIFELTLEVVQEPAPKFYLTTGSAKVIIYRAKKAWRAKKRRQINLPQNN